MNNFSRFYYEVNSDADLIDNSYHINAYEKKREKDLKRCSHPQYSMHCKDCKRVIGSELKNPQQKTIIELKEYIFLLEYTLKCFLTGYQVGKNNADFNLNTKSDVVHHF